jgi:hypothetical protein
MSEGINSGKDITTTRQGNQKAEHFMWSGNEHAEAWRRLGADQETSSGKAEPNSESRIDQRPVDRKKCESEKKCEETTKAVIGHGPGAGSGRQRKSGNQNRNLIELCGGDARDRK